MDSRARSWMTSEVRTVSPSTSLEDVIDLLAAEHVGSVPVVDKGVLLGVLSGADLVRRMALEHSLAGWMLDTLMSNDTSEARSIRLSEFVAHRLEGQRVEQLMNVSPVTVNADSDMCDVAKEFVSNRIHHAPVVEGRQLVGMVSTFDIARWVAAKGGA